MTKDKRETKDLFVKDPCAGCEHPEVVSLLFPRIEALEKKLTETREWIDESNNCCDNTQSQIQDKIEQLEKRVNALEDWQKIILSILRDNGFLKFKPFPDFPT